jgi:hypothetical protein
VVLLSDHGEEFFDHGGLDHGHTLFDELLSVPLIFSLPGTLPTEARLAGQARLIDVAPTILDLLGMEPPEHFEGTSLRPSMTERVSGIAAVPAGERESALLPQADAFAEALRRNETLKCVSSYPWKLILDTRTSERSLFNLEEDPHEQRPIGGKPTSDEHRLEQAIYRTLFAMTDSWYVEMEGGGQSHTFDVSIDVGQDPVPGSIGVHSLLDTEGSPATPGSEPQVEATRTDLRISGYKGQGKTRLAFTAEPGRAQIKFDLAIDGKPATSRTFLGRSMARPEMMPFLSDSGDKLTRSRGAPAGEIDAPYFLIWHSRSRFTGANRISLNDGTAKALKALGYIQ